MEIKVNGGGNLVAPFLVNSFFADQLVVEDLLSSFGVDSFLVVWVYQGYAY